MREERRGVGEPAEIAAGGKQAVLRRPHPKLRDGAPGVVASGLYGSCDDRFGCGGLLGDGEEGTGPAHERRGDRCHPLDAFVERRCRYGVGHPAAVSDGAWLRVAGDRHPDAPLQEVRFGGEAQIHGARREAGMHGSTAWSDAEEGEDGQHAAVLVG